MLIYLAVFLLLFIGGLRFHLLASCVVSLIDTLFIILLGLFLQWCLNKHTNRLYRARVVPILFIILSIFLFSNILCIIELEAWKQLLPPPTEKEWKMNPIYVTVLKDFMLVSGTTVASLFIHADKQRQNVRGMQLEKQDLELRLLKSRINPHFVFNVLNNIYSLAYTKSEKTAEMILKLSDLLRFTIDEMQMETIPIEKELQYIRNFIDLQLFKIENSKNMTLVVDIDDEHVKIPPLLLQPIIENCFKYSDIGTNKEARIDLNLTIKNKQFSFSAYNTKKRGTFSAISRPTGMGIDNLKQRLQLYYPGHYNLNIRDEEHEYHLDLYINLLKIIINNP
jgi:LytS/YehU family sensor histidine kinase